MRVIYKAPGCAPEPRDIPNTLEELQAAVGGGHIETVTIALDAVIICNEEGRLRAALHFVGYVNEVTARHRAQEADKAALRDFYDHLEKTGE